MKKLITLLFIIPAFQLMSQSKPVRIVFDVTSGDTLTHKAVLRHVSSMAATYPQSSFEVVVYGSALTMFVRGKSIVSKAVQELESNHNVSLKICEQAMIRNKIEISQLLPGVVTVPDGILEIVNKQAEGWGYIKETLR